MTSTPEAESGKQQAAAPVGAEAMLPDPQEELALDETVLAPLEDDAPDAIGPVPPIVVQRGALGARGDYQPTLDPDRRASATPTLAQLEAAIAALDEVAPAGAVGEALDATLIDAAVLELRFANLLPGYPDWCWVATLASFDAEQPSVLEVALLPGEGALLAPEWVPWADRLASYLTAKQQAEEGAVDDDLDEDDADDFDDFDDPDASPYSDIDDIDFDEAIDPDDPEDADDADSEAEGAGDGEADDDDSADEGDAETSTPERSVRGKTRAQRDRRRRSRRR